MFSKEKVQRRSDLLSFALICLFVMPPKHDDLSMLVSRRFRRVCCKLLTIALLTLWMAIAFDAFVAPTSAQSKPPEHVLPYPTQLMPGEKPGEGQCLVLDRQDGQLTPQEIYAENNWNFPERWIWRQLCSGEEANFYRFFFKAMLLSELSDVEIAKPILKTNETFKEFLDRQVGINAPVDPNAIGWDLDNGQILYLQTSLNDYLTDQANLTSVGNEEKEDAPTLAILFQKTVFDLLNLREEDQWHIDRFITDEVIRIEELEYLIDVENEIRVQGISVRSLFEACEERLLQNPDLASLSDDKKQQNMHDQLQKDYAYFVNNFLYSLNDRANILQEEMASNSENQIPQLTNQLKKLKDRADRLSLDSEFLQTILLRQPFLSALPGKVVIRGAYFNKNFDLSSADITQELRMEGSIFKEHVQLYKSKFSKTLSFDRSDFHKEVYLNNTNLQGNLFMREIDLVVPENTKNSDPKAQTLRLNLSDLQGQDIEISGDLENGELDFSGAQVKSLQIEPIHHASNSGGINNANSNSLESSVVFKLDDFQYEKVDDLGFDLLTHRLGLDYKKYAPPTLEIFWRDIEKMESPKTYSSLLQPFDQAASVARSLGRYRKERELLYKRKRLEVLAERAQPENRFLSPTYITLAIEDFLYGFGYHRFKAIKLFAFIWFLGTLLACREIFRKQYAIVSESLENRENESAKVLSHHYVSVQDVLRAIDAVSTVYIQPHSVRQRSTANTPRGMLDVFIECKPDSQDYKWLLGKSSRIGSNGQIPTHDVSTKPYIQVSFQEQNNQVLPVDLSINQGDSQSVQGCIKFINTISKNESITVVGCCNDFFPDTGKWILGDNIQGNHNLRLLNCNDQDADYHYPGQFLPEMSDNHPSVTQEVSRDLFHYTFSPWMFPRLFVGVGLTLLSILYLLPHHQWNFLYQVLIVGLFVLTFGYTVVFCSSDTGGWRGRFGNTFTFLFLLLLGVFLVIFRLPIIEEKTVWTVVCFLLIITVSLVIIWLRWSSIYSRQVVLLSMLFSLDSLLPIINLDETLHGFIFDDSKGFSRFFFLVQKIMAAILASILLPIFFVTGL